MEITKVSIRTNLTQREGGRLLAFGSIELDNALVIEHIRIVKTWDGRVLCCMPSIMTSAGIHKDAVHPKNKELRGRINDAIISELKRQPDPLTKPSA